MSEQQQEPVSWNPVWREVCVRSIQQGRCVRMAIADADAAVAAYRQRLAEDGKEVTHD